MTNRAFRAFHHAFLLIVCFRAAPFQKAVRLTSINLRSALEQHKLQVCGLAEYTNKALLPTPVLPNR
jgi:hypothetical protein